MALKNDLFRKSRSSREFGSFQNLDLVENADRSKTLLWSKLQSLEKFQFPRKFESFGKSRFGRLFGFLKNLDLVEIMYFWNF